MVTYGDIKTYVRDNFGDSVATKGVRVYERIVDRALRRLAKAADWSYYLGEGRVAFVAPYNTGTVSISQGSATLTLVGGTWPTDAATSRWHVLLGANQEVEFRIQTRTSDTVVQLASTWPFTAVSAGTYTAYRRDYALPTKFRKMVWGELENAWQMHMLTPREYTELRLRQANYSGDPQWFAIMEDKRLVVWPYPSAIRVLDFLYMKWPAFLEDSDISDSTTVDWKYEDLDLLYASVDVEVARTWGEEAPQSLEKMAAAYTYELQLARAADGERWARTFETYSHTDGEHRASRFRRHIPT